MKKKNTNIFLIIFFGIGIVGYISFTRVFQFANGAIKSIEKTNENIEKEAQKIDSLPNLKCRIVADSTVLTPLSGKSTSFYLLRLGNEIWVNYRRNESNRKNRLRLYNQEKIGEDYDYPMIAGYAEGTKLSIDDKMYDVDFEQCILSSRLGATEKMKRGIFSDRIISRNGNAIRNNNRIDSLKDKILFGMKGKHEWIDLYFKPNRGFDNIIVDEITFNNGDSIYIKAKIENNKIIPFIIHNSFGLN